MGWRGGWSGAQGWSTSLCHGTLGRRGMCIHTQERCSPGGGPIAGGLGDEGEGRVNMAVISWIEAGET